MKKEAGCICPFCKGENTEVIGTEEEDYTYYETWRCYDCHNIYTDIYNLQFVETVDYHFHTIEEEEED